MANTGNTQGIKLSNNPPIKPPTTASHQLLAPALLLGGRGLLAWLAAKAAARAGEIFGQLRRLPLALHRGTDPPRRRRGLRGHVAAGHRQPQHHLQPGGRGPPHIGQGQAGVPDPIRPALLPVWPSTAAWRKVSAASG